MKRVASLLTGFTKRFPKPITSHVSDFDKLQVAQKSLRNGNGKQNDTFVVILIDSLDCIY